MVDEHGIETVVDDDLAEANVADVQNTSRMGSRSPPGLNLARAFVDKRGDESETEMIDPSKFREQRRNDARARAATMTQERKAELQGKHGSDQSAPVPSGKSASSVPTYGTMDAVSLPIEDKWGPDPFMKGPSNDFLFPIRSGKSFNTDGLLPRRLRQGGWIYLRASGKLVARVRFEGVEHRDERIEHIPSPGGPENRGAGLVLAVDRDTWESCSEILGSPSESGNGYRYYSLESGPPVWTRVGD